MTSVTFLDAEHGPRAAAGSVSGDRIVLEPAALESLTGWSRKPEGLCRDEMCVPVRDDALDVDGGVDIARVATALGLPAVVDAAEGVVVLGAPAEDAPGSDRVGRGPRLHVAAARRWIVHLLVVGSAQEAVARLVVLVRLSLRPAGLAASQ